MCRHVNSRFRNEVEVRKIKSYSWSIGSWSTGGYKIAHNRRVQVSQIWYSLASVHDGRHSQYYIYERKKLAEDKQDRRYLLQSTFNVRVACSGSWAFDTLQGYYWIRIRCIDHVPTHIYNCEEYIPFIQTYRICDVNKWGYIKINHTDRKWRQSNDEGHIRLARQ